MANMILNQKEPIIIKGGLAVDDRGFLSFVNDFDFQGIKRFYQVQNHGAGFVRAFHGHKKEAKFVYVVKGVAKVCVISFGGAAKWFANTNKDPNDVCDEVETFVLSDKLPSVLWIPPGYLNGFKNLEHDTIIQFFSTSTLEESKGDDVRWDWNVFGAGIWEEEYR